MTETTALCATMTSAEQDLLRCCLQRVTSYLEWGSGASTLTALRQSNLQRVTCVESSAAFFEDLQKEFPELTQAREQQRLHVHLVDIGETGCWGYPTNDLQAHLWPTYSSIPLVHSRDFGLVLIDGRFRVACALAGLLSLGADTRYLVHDFWDRPEYRPLLLFFEVLESVDLLVLLKPRPVPCRRLVRLLMQHYQMLPGDHSPLLRTPLKVYALAQRIAQTLRNGKTP